MLLWLQAELLIDDQQGEPAVTPQPLFMFGSIRALYRQVSSCIRRGNAITFVLQPFSQAPDKNYLPASKLRLCSYSQRLGYTHREKTGISSMLDLLVGFTSFAGRTYSGQVVGLYQRSQKKPLHPQVTSIPPISKVLPSRGPSPEQTTLRRPSLYARVMDRLRTTSLSGPGEPLIVLV